MSDPRRAIPSIDRLLAAEPIAELLGSFARGQVTALLRQIQEEQRAGLAPTEYDAEWYARALQARLIQRDSSSLRRVINASGVVLHTNLGRAPLAPEALEAMLNVAGGYSNLEYALESGTRGSRYDHCRTLLSELTGAEDALVVNNNAAALILALNTIAAEREVVVSRGELVEIGGSFRVPEIMERSNARMREVGATNRVHLADYANGITTETAALLKVHPSNFRITGFTSEVELGELAALAYTRGMPLIHDLGSGLLFDLAAFGFPPEPGPRSSLEAGADLVTMSGDKLLGGPQAGIILGNTALISALRKNPLCRALRVDKLTLAALEATLRLYRHPERARLHIPALRMLTTSQKEIESRAHALVERLRRSGLAVSAVDTDALVGGGAFPDVRLPSYGIAIVSEHADALDARLRSHDPAIVGRIAQGQLILDLRTVAESEEAELERALLATRAG
ncbi:MAG: L-seryl-tRNA(Sec) selenium transferase [Gemmatimonadota bacterium]